MAVNLDNCWYCNRQIDSLSRTVDHFYPKSQGGILSNANKVPSCAKCNELKANLTPQEFVKSLNSMIYLQSITSKETIGYLKKVKYNVEKLIESNKK